MPISETTLHLSKNGTFTSTTKMFSGGINVEKGDWRLLQDTLVLQIKIIKNAYTHRIRKQPGREV